MCARHGANSPSNGDDEDVPRAGAREGGGELPVPDRLIAADAAADVVLGTAASGPNSRAALGRRLDARAGCDFAWPAPVCSALRVFVRTTASGDVAAGLTAARLETLVRACALVAGFAGSR